MVPAVGGTAELYHPPVPADDADAPDSGGETGRRGKPSSPELLPGGKTVLAEVVAASRLPSLIAIDVASGRRLTLLDDARDPQVVSTGHLLFRRDNDLMAVPFDVEAGSVTGTPVPVARGVSQYAVARNLLATTPISAQRLSTLVRVDRRGKETPLEIPPDSYLAPRVSPAGDQVSVTVLSGNNATDLRRREVWIYDLAQESRRQLTFKGSGFAVWSAEGDRLVFQSTRPGGIGLFSKLADGSADEIAVTAPGPVQVAHSFTPNGDLLYQLVDPVNLHDIMMLPAGETEPRPFLATPVYETSSRSSPDGRWVAYVSDEDGQLNVYVRPLAGTSEAKYRISTGGGRNPVWSTQGRELFYRNGDLLMKVDVAESAGGQSFTYSRPKLLFEARYYSHPSPFPQYDVLPNGDFVFIKALEGAPAHIQVVLNWAEELKHLVPAD